jgi:GNAT superfamily N-acetyltransferase
MLPGWDEAALLEEVLAPPRRAFFPLPDVTVVERPGWMQLITPAFKRGGMNEVSLSVLEDGEADSIIDATVAQYRGLGISFRWSVAPGSAPSDLGERLARRGLARTAGMCMASLTRDPPQVSHGSIRVEEVSPARVDEFTALAADAWQVDREPLLRLNRAVVEHPEHGQRLYLATFDGQPVATAAIALFERSAYLMSGVVLPEFRRRGVYRALVAARMRAARERGIGLVTCHAREQTSAPLLARMGFVSVCRYAVYHG